MKYLIKRYYSEKTLCCFDQELESEWDTRELLDEIHKIKSDHVFKVEVYKLVATEYSGGHSNCCSAPHDGKTGEIVRCPNCKEMCELTSE
jgi:hypothetical protein